jgi:hypothetical protein
MIRSTTKLKRTLVAIATACLAAAIVVPSASAFWLGGGLQQPSTTTTTSDTSNVMKTKHDTAKITLNNVGPSY